jgi:membrane dipeptidase
MPCQANDTDYSDEAYSAIVRATLQQLDTYGRLHDLYPEVFTPAESADGAYKAWKEDGRLISPIGIEGLHQIGNSPATLRLYYTLGARYVTLTWNCHNIYADAAVTRDPETGKFGPSKPFWGGISSKKGRDMIYEMNRLGMLVDLSHVSKDTMVDVLVGDNDKKSSWKGSVAPPIFSHSSVWALCPHPRNVPDDVLHMVKKRNSVVMINFSADFISCRAAGDPSKELPIYEPENATLAQVVKHIMYIGQLIGYDYVGLGSDFDGIDVAPKGLEDVSKFPDLVAELLKQGVSDEDVIKVIGGNVLRVWREADAVAGMLKLVLKPLEDEVHDRWG